MFNHILSTQQFAYEPDTTEGESIVLLQDDANDLPLECPAQDIITSDVKTIADKISDKLIKIVKDQLSAALL